jgi:hypothetical protein
MNFFIIENTQTNQIRKICILNSHKSFQRKLSKTIKLSQKLFHAKFNIIDAQERGGAGGGGS